MRHTLDALGRATRSDIRYGTTDGQGAFDFAIGQGFDHDGQIASHTYPDGSQQSYGYSHGRLSQISLPNQAHISYRDYNWRTPSLMDVPGATKTIHSDALQRPESITVRGSANQVLASRAYQYDPAGNITQIDSDLGQIRYGYDPLNRLIEVTPDNTLQAMGLPQEQYSYDAVGNRIASAHQPGTWAYNQDNQLVQYPRTMPLNQTQTPAVDTQVTYTPQGHASQESNQQGTERYGYNAAERLVHYTETPAGQPLPSVEAQYRYDPFGRRIAKTVKQGSATETTYYLYNDNGLMAEADGQGKITKAYGFNPQAGLWSTDPVWQAQVSKSSLIDAATGYHYLHTDHLRTPVLATDSRGETSWKAVAQAFGATGVLPESTIAMHLRFPGQYFDGERGGHYNFHRDYRADLGRYLQSDPIGVAGGENVFAYVQENPLKYTDPRGLDNPSMGPYGPGPNNYGENASSHWQRAGALTDFIRNFRNMRDANTKLSDKYFHCKANCEATRRGPFGEALACNLSDMRELWDQYSYKWDSAQDSLADQAANALGRSGALSSSQACSAICDMFRPNGLPTDY